MTLLNCHTHKPYLLKPLALRTGDAIGVFTPSAPAHLKLREKYLHGLRQLEALGFRTIEGPLTAKQVHEGYRSGTPQERAAEFMALIDNPEVRCLIATIGGYNSSSLVPYLDFERIREARKIICGYSDVTALHLAINELAGLSTFYGPAVVPSFGEWPDVLSETAESFLDAACRHRSGRRLLIPPRRWSSHFRDAATDAWKTETRRFETNLGWKTLNTGVGAGPLRVANLNTMMAVAGTPLFPELEGTILAIEEMNAPLSFEERSLRQLDLMGVFDRIAGLLIGKPEVLDLQGAPFGYDDLVLEVVGPRQYPIVSGFDCSHTHPMLTLAEGVSTTLSARGSYDVEMVIEEPMAEF
jgi:muramoyltetrapeptide carboxypeptidase LdcA involved in peptidoglycan recycling